MHYKSRSILLTALTGVAALLAQAAVSEPSKETRRPAAGTFFFYPERIAFEDGGRVEAERGVLYVPLRRSDPAAGTLSVEVYRFRAGPQADAATPPVFILNGGPGWPGLAGSLERSGYYESRIRPLTELADVVVVGQRGIGSSKPDTACEPPPEVAPDAELSEAEELAIVRRTSRRCKDFWEGRGLDLTGLTVVEAAADVDDVRRALGYDKITLWGGSFGSHWSMAILRFYPEIVARAVLTGLEGPDHTYDMPGDVLKAVERMAAAAEASPALAPHLPEEGLVAALRQLIARVESEPVLVAVPDPESEEPRRVRFDADDVRSMVLGYSGTARSRGRLPKWPLEVLEIVNGDFTRAAQRALGRDRGFPTASFFMLDCGSGISRARLEKLLADPAAEVVGELGGFYQAACPVWGSDLGEDFRQNFTTEIPTALIHGNWDTSTPFENALELAPFFKNGKLVVVKGGTHGALREALSASEPFRDALAAFVRTGDLSVLPDEVDLPPIDWEIPPKDSEPATR